MMSCKVCVIYLLISNNYEFIILQQMQSWASQLLNLELVTTFDQKN